MNGIFLVIRKTKTLFPRLKSCDKTRVSLGKSGGSIIHLLGREQNPARFKIMEVSVW